MSIGNFTKKKLLSDRRYNTAYVMIKSAAIWSHRET